MRSIAIAGSVAQRTGYGGHAWALLQYALGFRRLGYEVLFIDRLTPEMAADRSGRHPKALTRQCIDWFVGVMRWAGLEGSYALLLDGDDGSVGLSRAETLKRVGDSQLLLNIMGFITDEAILEAAPRRAFLDIDPGFGQMWSELGLANPFQGHDAFVTVGENIGSPECRIPTCSLDWVTTPQPIALDLWPPV